MTEAELQQAVIECARLFGWRVAHFRPARTKHGWATPVSADGKGFPDLILIRGEWLLAVELKAEGGRLSPEQHDWILALEQTPALTYVWRPKDWLSGSVDAVLRDPAGSGAAAA